MTVLVPAKVAAALAPVIKYHPRERFFLDDAEDYFARTVPHTSADGKKARVMKAGAAPANYAYPKVEETVPVFYRILQRTDYYYIVYYLFFPYNGPKRVLGLVPVGQHTADIETIAVKVRSKDNRVLEYKMTNHGDYVAYALEDPGRGRFGPDGAPLVRVDEAGHPIVYTSLNGHGLYNEPGSYLRVAGIGNDVTADGGPSTRALPVELAADSPLLLWQGRFGDEGVNGFYKRGNPEDEKTIPRHTRIPGFVASLAYAIYAVLPLVAYYLRGPAVAAAVFVGQFFVLKVVLTIVFPLVGAPPPNPDEWWRWFLPLRLD